MGLFFGGSWLYRVYVYIDIRVGYILIFRAVGFCFLGSCLCGIYVYLDIRVGYIYIWRAIGFSFSLNTLVLGVSLTASTSPEDGHAGNQQISGPSGASKIFLFLK